MQLYLVSAFTLEKIGVLKHHICQVGRQQHLLKALSTLRLSTRPYLRNHPAYICEILHDHFTEHLAHTSQLSTCSTNSFVNLFVNCILWSHSQLQTAVTQKLLGRFCKNFAWWRGITILLQMGGQGRPTPVHYHTPPHWAQLSLWGCDLSLRLSFEPQDRDLSSQRLYLSYLLLQPVGEH